MVGFDFTLFWISLKFKFNIFKVVLFLNIFSCVFNLVKTHHTSNLSLTLRIWKSTVSHILLFKNYNYYVLSKTQQICNSPLRYKLDKHWYIDKFHKKFSVFRFCSSLSKDLEDEHFTISEAFFETHTWLI